MKYLIRITLESKDDIIREIEINSEEKLVDLHNYLIKIFDLNTKELASFFTVDNDLEIQQEIPLFSFEENNPKMEDFKLENLLFEKHDKLIYLFDYMKMWRFLVELIDIQEGIAKKRCTMEIGKIPKEAPEIIFSIDLDNDSHFEKDEEYY